MSEARGGGIPMGRIKQSIKNLLTFAVISASVLFLSHSAFAAGVEH
jgi:hypothetical protein